MADEHRGDVDLESTPSQKGEGGLVSLEPVDGYVRRVRAEIRLSWVRAANVVAYILVAGVVGSLPLYVLAVGWLGEAWSKDAVPVFTKWYDVVSPLLGAVIGALFGITIATRQRDGTE